METFNLHELLKQNKKISKKSLITIILIIICMTGCGTKSQVSLYSYDINELNFEENVIEKEILENNKIISKDKLEITEEKGRNIEYVMGEDSNLIYIMEYYKDGAQYSEKYEVYKYDLDEKDNSLIYETDGTYWLNETVGNQGLYFWVEFKKRDNKTNYDIKKYEITTGLVETVLTLDGDEYYAPSLAFDDGILSCYCENSEGTVVFWIYDYSNNENEYIENLDVTKMYLYSRIHLKDGYLTYFMDQDGKIYIVRYNIRKKEKEIVLLGNVNEISNLNGCLSNDDFICWYTGKQFEYLYYLYDKRADKVYKLNTMGMNIFTRGISEEALYLINHDENNTVYKIDLLTMQIYSEKCDNTLFSQLYEGENNILYGYEENGYEIEKITYY